MRQLLPQVCYTRYQVFSEINTEILLSSSVHETSFVHEDDESDGSDSNEEDRLRQLTMKIWIAQMANSKTLL